MLHVEARCCSSSKKQLVPSSLTKLSACASKENPQLVWENRRGPHSACGSNVKKQLVTSVRTTHCMWHIVATTLQYVAATKSTAGSHFASCHIGKAQLSSDSQTLVDKVGITLTGVGKLWTIINKKSVWGPGSGLGSPTWGSLWICVAYIFYGEVVSIPTQQFLSTKSPDPQPHKKRKFELKRNTNGISCFPHEISFEDSSPLTWPLFLLLFSILLQLRYLEYFPFCRQ